MTNRYKWNRKKKLEKKIFEQLAEDIQAVEQHVWKLYTYIYASQELKLLTESMTYGHSDLRTHLNRLGLNLNRLAKGFEDKNSGILGMVVLLSLEKLRRFKRNK